MKPHPLFRTYAIPAVPVLDDFTLRALTINDLERDFNAIVESAADIKAANPGTHWPDGLTMAWHQREFESRRSFAWVIENANGGYLGCLYVYPSIAGEESADVAWWWRTGAVADRNSFRSHLLDWLSGKDWPRLSYRLQDH